MKYDIGNKVFLKKGIPLYKNANANTLSSYNNKDRNTVITRRVKGTKHPYNTTGDLGWVNESDIKLQENPIPKYECEIELTDKDGLIDYIKTHDDKIIIMSSDDLKKVLGL